MYTRCKTVATSILLLLALYTTSSLATTTTTDDIIVEDNTTQASKNDATTPNPLTASSPNGPSDSISYHNLSREYVAHTLARSPLVELYQSNAPHKDDNHNNNVNLIYTAHNPETQGIQMALCQRTND